MSLGFATLSVRAAGRPLAIGLAATALLLIASVKTTQPSERPREAIRMLAGIGFLTLFWSIGGVALFALDRACGGLDSYAYVSTAHLLRSGRLSQAEPLAAALPFDNSLEASAPLGYQPSPRRDGIVPTFPIGFPLVMAAFMALFGEGGAFYVPFVLGVGAVVLVYRLARRRMAPPGASLAAVLVAVNPIFVNEAIQPMSDVPATFWTLAAVYAITRPRPAPVVAGLAAGMAVLTRPPLLLLAAVVAWMAWRSGRRPLHLYVTAFAPLFVLLALVQWRLYGNPLVSGHGSAGELFVLNVPAVNAWHHLKWLTLVHTPLLFIASAVGLTWGDRRFGLQALALFAMVTLPYLLYTVVFDDWEMLRFLLPGLVFLLIVAADGIQAAAARLRLGAATDALLLVLATAATLGAYTFADRHGVLKLKEGEAKYPLVGWWLQTNAPADAVVFASLHSGSVRFYSGRTTLNFLAIPSASFKDTVVAMRRLGRPSYLVLDGPSESQLFRGRFQEVDLRGVVMDQRGRIRDIDIFTLDTLGTAP